VVNSTAAGFIDELRSDSERATLADAVSHALQLIDSEADTSPHAAALFEGLTWIIGHTDRTVEQRLRAIVKLLSLQGRVEIIDLKDLLGWT
jgi:hypothetical protein